MDPNDVVLDISQLRKRPESLRGHRRKPKASSEFVSFSRNQKALFAVIVFALMLFVINYIVKK